MFAYTIHRSRTTDDVQSDHISSFRMVEEKSVLDLSALVAEPIPIVGYSPISSRSTKGMPSMAITPDSDITVACNNFSKVHSTPKSYSSKSILVERINEEPVEDRADCSPPGQKPRSQSDANDPDSVNGFPALDNSTHDDYTYNEYVIIK
jgi:hypothetical protein